MRLIVATNNKGKLLEIQQILCDCGIELLTLSDIGLDVDFLETGETFEENAIIKAKTVYELKKMPVLADDSGLIVDALEGQPGIRTSRYAGEGATDDQNIDKLLTNMKEVADKDRSARFICAIAYIDNDGNVNTFCGECEGFITKERRGIDGMGYDPVFFYPPFNSTFAESSYEQKNKVSHRKKALFKFKDFLVKNKN
jgi:XTP/dITP diphosphohydrolase